MAKHFLSFVFLFLFSSLGLWAQQGVGTSNPNPSAALEVVSPDKGVLIPRLSLTASATFAPITGTASSSHEGLLVYNTNTATNTGLNGTGYYYWSGTTSTTDGAWLKMGSGGESIYTSDDSLTASRTVNLNDYLLNFESTQATPTLAVDGLNARVGIGTTTPTVPFQVIGEGDFRTVYIADNTSAASTISAQATTVIDDGDWAADSSNSRWYLAKLSDNTTVRSGTNQVVIDDSGNLGLGTASPDDQLEVTGSAQFAGVVKDASGSAGTAGQILSSTASGVAWIPAEASNTDSQTIAFGSSATSSQTTLEITDGNALTLQASGALSFTQTGTNTLELAVAVVDSNTDSQTIAFDDASATATETTITLDNSQALTLIASGTLSMSNSNSTTLLLTASDDSDWSSDAANSLWQLGTQSDKSTARTLGTEFVITDAGIVGIGVTSVNASARLDVNGDVYAAGILLTSDARYKTNVQELTDALDIVLKLRGVRHEWKQGFKGKKFSEGTVLGLIAQEVEPYLPEVVHTDAKGYKSVDYTKLTPLLIEAIQSQQEQIDAQEARLMRIEKQLGINK